MPAANSFMGYEMEMIYLGGDDCNKRQAIVNVKAMPNGLVIQSPNGEDRFTSIFIPKQSITEIEIANDDETARVSMSDKPKFGEVYSHLMVSYMDQNKPHTIHLKLDAMVSKKKNSTALKEFRRYIVFQLEPKEREK